MVEVLEDGLKNGKIAIPGAVPGRPDGFDDVENVTGYLNTFGATVAQRIRDQFQPLFDPALEPLSEEVLAVNDTIQAKAGYSLYDAQLAVAEATKRQLDRKKIALIVAECGSGKTKIGATALAARYGALKKELEDLESRRFDGLDRKGMEQRMVELSSRYSEALRDQGGELAALREKLAARRAEQYQSQYTAEIVKVNARLSELGARFNQDKNAFKTFVPGMTCPTCRRLITEDALAEVRSALERSAKEVYAAGQEQRAQLNELKELEAKAAAVFRQFQADDVAKLEEQITAFQEAGSPAKGLEDEIRQLSADLEYGNLSQQEYDRLTECREELRDCAAQLAAAQTMAAEDETDFDAKIKAAQDKIMELKKLMSSVAVYMSKRAELTFSALKMNKVEISLYDIVKTTGERKDVFKFTYGGRRYDRLSLSEKIRAGMEVSELMKRLTGRNYPVFVDNMESVDDLANVMPTGQIIMAKCVSGTPLAVRPVKPIAVVERQAA